LYKNRVIVAAAKKVTALGFSGNIQFLKELKAVANKKVIMFLHIMT